MKNSLAFWAWLRKIIYFWVKSVAMPADWQAELGIDPKKPICFVLKTNSLADLLVTEQSCRELGMPLPHLKPRAIFSNGAFSSFVYLFGIKWLTVDRDAYKSPPSAIYQLLKLLSNDPTSDIQLVPVSVFWGRRAPKEESSFWRLFFSDDDHASLFRKIFIIFFQGKNVQVHFSKAISMREQLTLNPNREDTARKITRVLRVHFNAKRTAVLGPSLISRERVVETLIRSKALTYAISEEARKKNIPKFRAEKTARRYLREISADFKPSFVSAAAILLRRVWNHIYRGVEIHHTERLRQIPPDHCILYMPCHRAHMDYLLISYVLFNSGVSTPHVAAGVNLNFWPMGLFLRRIGAFYIRRKFGSNRLYAAAYNEYVHFLLGRRTALKFYMEGGRSRTGKILNPKTGMLSMTMHSFLRLHDQPISIVPVYVSYDKIAEIKSYRKELSGESKQPESFAQFISGVRNIFRANHGKAYVSFGQPLEMGHFLDQKIPDWRNSKVDFQTKPAWLGPVAAELSHEVATRINCSTVAGPVSLVALILLATRQKALAEDEMSDLCDRLRELLKNCPYSPDATLPSAPPKQLIKFAEEVAGIKRFHYPDGDVVYAAEPQASYIIYYRNTIVQLFALPSLIAAFFQYNDQYNEKELIRGVKSIYPVLKKELFLPFFEADIENYIEEILRALVELKFLEKNGSNFLRPDVTTKDFSAVKILGWIIGPAVERYALTVSLLLQKSLDDRFTLTEFQNSCLLMAQRLSILTGAGETDKPTASLFKIILDQLKDLHYLEKNQDDLYQVTTEFKSAHHVISGLLSSDMRLSIARSAAKHSPSNNVKV